MIFLLQPHVPVRLPCYDFIPVTNPKMTIIYSTKKFKILRSLKEANQRTDFLTNKKGFKRSSFPACDGRCVQDLSTNSPQLADLRLLVIPPSCRRVAASNPNTKYFKDSLQITLLYNALYIPLQHVCSPVHKGHKGLTSFSPSSNSSLAVF